MADPRFPIGQFQAATELDADQRTACIEEIEHTPIRLTDAIRGLKPSQLDTPYRDGGWTVRQVIHHVADSHMHSYIRFRMALTENEPEVKPYPEKLWALLPDSLTAPPEISLALLEPLHERWAMLLRALNEHEWSRAYLHPEMGAVTLNKAVQLYAWHGRHHAAHITKLREAEGWNS